MHEKKTVLLLNAEGVQSLCLARAMRKQGYRVIGFCSTKISSGYVSRWLHKRYITPNLETEQGSYLMYLISYLKNHQVDIIIPLADASAEFLSRNKRGIEGQFGTLCVITDYELYLSASNKYSLMQFCKKNGIDHPRTYPLDGTNDEAALDFVKLPAIIKPNCSQGAKGILRIENLQDLKNKYAYTAQHFGECSLQQFIEQRDYYYNVMLYRDRNGNMDNYTIIKILRYFPLKGGSSCCSQSIEHPALLALCRKLLDKLQWRGLADIDILEDKNTGELKVIELNPRAPSSFEAAFASGVDFGAVLCADLLGKEIPHCAYVPGKTIRWMGLDAMWFVCSPMRWKIKPSWLNFSEKTPAIRMVPFGTLFPWYSGLPQVLLNT